MKRGLRYFGGLAKYFAQWPSFPERSLWAGHQRYLRTIKVGVGVAGRFKTWFSGLFGQVLKRGVPNAAR